MPTTRPTFTAPSKSQVNDLQFYAAQRGYDFDGCCTVEECKARAEESGDLDAPCYIYCPELELPEPPTFRDFFAAFKPGSIFFE